MNLTIEKLVFGGQGLARHDGKVYFVWNALPGEEVEVEIVKESKNFSEAVATKIIKKSPHRLVPTEDHFLSCSAWQIMDFESENEWKKITAKEVYQKFSGLTLDDSLEIVSDEKSQINYRNKMEYHFIESDGEIKFAFFERGGAFLVPLEGSCFLANKEIEKAGKFILAWLNGIKAPVKALKTLILRFDGEKVLAGLVIREKIKFASMPEIGDDLAGLHIFFADPQKPSNWLPNKLKFVGKEFLTAKINNRNLNYGLLSFFQVNENIFYQALEDISNFVDEDSQIVDFYSGVGTIGLGINKKIKSGVLVEVNPEAVKFAKENITKNKIKNFKAVCAQAEKALEYITKDKTIIFDPVRAGLHPNIIKKVLEEKPGKIIYLSCDPATQARDLKQLSAIYSVKFFKLYNFFPRTPHIEALVVLELK